MNRIQVYVFTFLCYTSIHTLRTSYSCAKKNIAQNIDIEYQFMGIVDALMLGFLGLGHFFHTLKPIKKPVKSLFIAMILCGINYGLIPLCMFIKGLRNIFILSVLMCFNGYLQSFTWPNLLMIIHEKFDPQQYSVLLGFWTTNTNFGNIIGYSIFLMLTSVEQTGWKIQLMIAAVFAIINGIVIALRFRQVEIAGPKDIKQKAFMHYDLQSVFSRNNQIKVSFHQNLEQNLIDVDVQSVKSFKSIKSEKSMASLLSLPISIGGLSMKSMKLLKQIEKKINRHQIKSVKIVKQPEKVAETPLSITEVFKDPNVVLLTITFSLSKSVIYGIMLWLPLYFQESEQLKKYNAQIPITYEATAIFGSVVIGYLFKRITNKGFLMIPFMIALFICFFVLKFAKMHVSGYFITIAAVGFALGGIFNTLSGLVVMQLTKVIPENLKTSSLGFYSALTMAVGNITTALTQILIGFVLGKDNKQGIFVIFMVYSAICLICLVLVAIITHRLHGAISIGQTVVIEEVERQDDEISEGEQKPYHHHQLKQSDVQLHTEVYVNKSLNQSNIQEDGK